MKKILIYGGTELSAAESWFIVSLTYELLSSGEVIIVNGGFLFDPRKRPGDISTDYSVLQGAKKYAAATGRELSSCLETWLPDRDAEIDPLKKNVERFREGKVIDLPGESAQARRFSMVRDVDVVITVKGRKHTAVILEFAKTMNKPALPLPFTGGDSLRFWANQNALVKKWFDLTEDLAGKFETEDLVKWTPSEKDLVIKAIVAAVFKGLRQEELNNEHYQQRQIKFKEPENFKSAEIVQNTSEKQNPKDERKEQLSVFLAYSHKDKELKDQLKDHLFALIRMRKISVWHDQDIEGGEKWDETIKEKLRNADIILPLISPGFVNSDYAMNEELNNALEKQQQGNARVIPIFLRKVFTKGLPFDDLQGYISKDEPIESSPDINSAFYTVVEKLNDDIDKWLMK